MSLFFTRPDPYLHLGTFPLPRMVKLHIGGAPGFMESLRVLFLSDVHLRPGVCDAKLNALIDLIAAQKADLVLLGGDYAETPEQLLRFFAAFQSVHAPLGIYAVPGNNDSNISGSLREIMSQAGIVLLKNESTLLCPNGGKLEIGGCDDHKYGTPLTRNIFNSSDASYRILISHYPVLPDCECDLMLSGHTHAGQFNFLGVTPYSIFFEHRYRFPAVRGLHRKNKLQLFIGNGIGISRIPVRLGAEPQIYLLEFGKKEF